MFFKKVSLVTGGFDPIHSGHIAYFERAKDLSDYLVVGLNTNEWLTRKKIAAELREELKKEVSNLKVKYNKVPGLTVILIGDLTPSQIYVRNKEKSANEV